MKKLFNLIFPISVYEEHEPATLRHNLSMHLTDGILFFFGASFISMQTVIPVFIELLGGSPLAIASVQAFSIIGLNLPQLLVIGKGFNPPRLLPLILRYSGMYRLMFLVIGIFTFFIPFVSSETAVFTVIAMIIFSSFIGSLAGPMWFHLLFLTTPVKLRGRLMGVRQFAGSLLGILGGLSVKLILDNVSFPYSFALMFLLAFFFLLISWFFVKGVKEPPREMSESAESKTEILGRMAEIIKKDRRYRNFIIADFIILMAYTATSFFAIYGINKFELKPGSAGTFTMIMMATMTVSNILFGIIADRMGHKINLQIVASSVIFSCVTAIFAPGVYIYWLVFVFAAILLAVQGISRIAFVAELCEEKDRIAYIGLLNFITSPALLFGMLSGYLIKLFSFEVIFAADAALAALALLILTTKVKNPRSGK